jgi:uncharacterized membrane protein
MIAYMYNDHMGRGWAVFMTLSFLPLIALVIVVAVSVVRERGGATSREILDRRLASGEISVEEYERTRDAMSAEPPRGTPTGPAAPA